MHDERAQRFALAVEAIQQGEAWAHAEVTRRDAAILAVTRRACPQATFTEQAAACAHCHTPLSTLREDLGLVEALAAQTHAALVRLAPEPPPSTARRVRAATFFREPLKTLDDVQVAVEALRQHLAAIIAAGESVEVE